MVRQIKKACNERELRTGNEDMLGIVISVLTLPF